MDKFLSIDTETDSKDPNKANLKVVGVASSPTESSYYLYPRDKDKIQELLATPLPKVAHNIKYDYKVLLRHGFTVNGRLEDTLILAQVNGNIATDNLKLKTLANFFFKQKNKTFDDLMCKFNPNAKKISQKVDNIPTKVLGKYCANDACLQYRLYILLRELTDTVNLKMYDTVEVPLLAMVIKMEQAGIRVDIDEIHKLTEAYENSMSISELYAYEYAGEEFNMMPSLSLEHMLFEKMKYPCIKYTDSGRPTTDEHVLRRMQRGGCVLTEYVLDYRIARKIISTYLTSYLKKQVNGRIHTNLHQTGTKTTRFASSNPNLQNVHPAVKKVFTASPGNKLVRFDYKQMELVMLAHCSQDKRLVESCMAGIDLHDAVAEGLHVDRDTAKVVNFAIPYRQGAWGLSKTLKCKTEIAQQLLDNHKETYAGVEEYVHKMIRFCRDNGYVETFTGRKRFLTEEDTNTAHFESQCVNTPIQGGCAEIVKQVMLKCDEAGYIPILQVHDELLFDWPEADVDKNIPIVKDIMENTVKLSVPLRVSCKAGDNWKECK